MSACQSYRPGETICADGFIQRYACWKHSKCFHCGQDSDPKYLPHCMRDELPDWWLTEDGRPIFYKGAQAPVLNTPHD